MKRAGRDFWFNHLERCANQGVSLAQYARRESLSIGSLYGWHLKFKEVKAGIAAGSVRKAERERPNFIALQVASPLAVDRMVQLPPMCRLQLGGGVCLELSALPSPAWLVGFERERLNQQATHAHR
jgi:hypothetical protein